MSDIKNQIRNNNTSLTQSQINFKKQSAKQKLRTTNNTNNFIETHYSISLREKYLKQGPLTNNQKKFKKIELLIEVLILINFYI